MAMNGGYLKRLRKRYQLSQEEMADLTDFHYKHYQKMEEGHGPVSKRMPFELDKLRKLFQARKHGISTRTKSS